jgi:excisionase family DNA binding protein
MARLLTQREAADELGCSVATVKRRIASGALPVFRDGRLVRVRGDDLTRYIAERVTRGSSRAPVLAGHVLAPGERLWD